MHRCQTRCSADVVRGVERLSAGSPMSCCVVRARSEEEEALDTLMPLPKRLKTTCTSLYQISKLGLSLDVGDIPSKLVVRWSQLVPASSIDDLLIRLQQLLSDGSASCSVYKDLGRATMNKWISGYSSTRWQ